MDFDSAKEHETDVEIQTRKAKDKPDIWFEFSYEAFKKTDKNGERYTDGPEVFYSQGNKSRCLGALAIKYLIVEKMICGIDHLSTE